MKRNISILDARIVKSNPVYHHGVGVERGQYGYYKKIDDSWQFIPCGGAIGVGAYATDIETFEDNLLLQIEKDGQTMVCVMPREELNENALLKMQKYGVQVNKKSAPVLLKVIENLIQDTDRYVTHSHLGFGEWAGKPIFKAHKGIGVDSRYFGSYRVTPNGSFEKWKTMVKEEVLGWIPLEFVLCAAISGLLVDLLKEDISCENILIGMIGNSSTGKTTGGLLGVSCGAVPDFKDYTLVFNLMSTANSLMKLIPNSYPCLLDEGSLIPDNKNLTQFLYSLSSGVEKKRLSGATMEVGESSQFRTTIFLTSEKSLLSQCNQNSGLLVRNFEFQNVMWTKSAESADKIKEVISHNNAHLIHRVAKWLLLQNKMEIIVKVQEEAKMIIQRAKDTNTYNSLTERSAKQVALIMESVDILQEVLKMHFHKEEILSFIEEHSLVRDMEQVSLGKRAMEWLLQYLTKNKIYFRSEDVQEVSNGCKGRLQKTNPVLLGTGEESTLRLYIGEFEFAKMLQEGGFSEPVTVLKDWKGCGYLKTQKDRYLSRIKIVPDIQIKGYIVCIPTTTVDMQTKDGFQSAEKVIEDELNSKELEELFDNWERKGKNNDK